MEKGMIKYLKMKRGSERELMRAKFADISEKCEVTVQVRVAALDLYLGALFSLVLHI